MVTIVTRAKRKCTFWLAHSNRVTKQQQRIHPQIYQCTWQPNGQQEFQGGLGIQTQFVLGGTIFMQRYCITFLGP